MSDVPEPEKSTEINEQTGRCRGCGFRVHGKNHAEGWHHRVGVDGRTGPPAQRYR